MNNTRLMSRLFSATEEKDEELTAQVGKDIEDARRMHLIDLDMIVSISVGNIQKILKMLKNMV